MKIKRDGPLLQLRSYIKLLIILLTVFMPQTTLGSEDIQENIPFSTVIVLGRAQSLVQKSKSAEALDLLESFKQEQVEQNKQLHPFLLFTLGNYHMEDNNAKKAALNYEACVKLEKGEHFASAWLNLAKASYDLERFKRAGDSFIKGYELEEKKRGILLYYGANAFFSAEEYSLALGTFNRLTEDHPDDLEPRWRELAVHILMALEMPRKALPHMEFLAQNLEGDHKSRWQETLLYHYMTLGMDQKALSFVSFLTREYPLEPRWWKGVARLSLDKNDLTRAVSAMTIYGFLTPLTNEEKKLMADLYLSVGVPERAIDFYEQIPFEEKRVEILKNTIAALQQMHLYEKALEFIDQVLITQKSSNESSGELKIIKGNLLFSMERFEDSANLFESIAPQDSSGQSWLMLGYSRWNLGEIKSAKRAMAKAATFKQHKKAANRAIKSLSLQTREP